MRMQGGRSRNAAAARSNSATAEGATVDSPCSSMSGRMVAGGAPRGVPVPGVEPGEVGVDLLLLDAQGGISDAGENGPHAGELEESTLLRSRKPRRESQLSGPSSTVGLWLYSPIKGKIANRLRTQGFLSLTQTLKWQSRTNAVADAGVAPRPLHAQEKVAKSSSVRRSSTTQLF